MTGTADAGASVPRLPTLARGPAPGQAAMTVVLLHGRHQAAESIMEVARRVGVDWIAWLAPQAPGNSWYPRRFDECGPGDPDVTRAMNAVETLLDGVRGPVGLVGFSQGACLAAQLVWSRRPRIRFAAVLTGSLLGQALPYPGHDGALGGVHALFTGGAEDEWVPAERVRGSSALFADAGASVATSISPGKPHGVDDEEIGLIRSHLQAITRARAA